MRKNGIRDNGQIWKYRYVPYPIYKSIIISKVSIFVQI